MGVIGPSGLAPLALHQLAGWQQIALTWPLALDLRGAGDLPHLMCADCMASVVPLGDAESRPYHVTPQQALDATVRHLRARHAELEPPGL
jgi:hypothetical protein